MPRGHPMSARQRAAQSARMKGHGWGGKRHVGGHKGHRMTAAQKAKISKALKGKKHPHRGHAATAATRAKISAALKKRRAAAPRSASKAPRAARSGGRHVAARSLANLRRPARGSARHKDTLARGVRTHKFRSGAHRLISSATYRKRTGLIHHPRKHRTRIVIHRRVRHHRVWRRRKRR